MIPLKLHIQNFLSYGAPQDIDFEPYSLICLSGKNGHGKSALLDALTWVLWGQARKASGVSKADEGLLHLGKTDMKVSLDFQCNGILYRIKREFTLSSKGGQTNLEFGVLNKETGTFKPLTDKTIRTTQAKIVYTVGLDYEAFINSAFIRQGQSHEFSKKSPKERKDILAAILGLERFEQIRRLALDTAKDAQNSQDQAKVLLEQIDIELAEKPRVLERLKAIDDALRALLEQEKELQEEYGRHKKRYEQVQSHKVTSETLTFKKEHLARALEDELIQIRASFRTWREVARKQRQEGADPHLDTERSKIQQELSTLQLRAAQKVKQKEEFLIKKEHLRELLQKLQDEQKLSQEHLDRQAHTIALDLKTVKQKQQERTQRYTLVSKELEGVTQRCTSLNATVSTSNTELIETAEKKFERRKGFYHSFISRIHSLKSMLEELAQKKQLINSSEQAQCPLCEQVTDRDKLTRKFSKDEHLRAHQLRRLNGVCNALKAALLEEHAALEGLKKQREQNTVAQSQVTELSKQQDKLCAETDELTQELSEIQRTLTTLERRSQELIREQATQKQQYELLRSSNQIKQLEQEVHTLHKEAETSAYDPAYELALTNHLVALTQKSDQQQAFKKELALQDERRRIIHEKCAQARIVKQQLAELSHVDSLKVQVPLSEDQLKEQETLLSQTVVQLTREKESLIHQKGAFEAQVTHFKQKEQDYKQQMLVVKECTDLVDDYSALASAFSKDGIQALLIEDALPEIEEEANKLLSRLTDNQAHMSIDSLRDTKSGKTKETLDIKIADAAGVRPYEMFSGGEAFRIDFSLRIALSKLLARRAGTALQTLIIDEGFGSQDEEGLAHITEALYSIRDDFAKVLIVSHLPSLKEQFPVHFQIEKTGQGSVVSVIEHC